MAVLHHQIADPTPRTLAHRPTFTFLSVSLCTLIGTQHNLSSPPERLTVTGVLISVLFCDHLRCITPCADEPVRIFSLVFGLVSFFFCPSFTRARSSRWAPSGPHGITPFRHFPNHIKCASNPATTPEPLENAQSGCRHTTITPFPILHLSTHFSHRAVPSIRFLYRDRTLRNHSNIARITSPLLGMLITQSASPTVVAWQYPWRCRQQRADPPIVQTGATFTQRPHSPFSLPTFQLEPPRSNQCPHQPGLSTARKPPVTQTKERAHWAPAQSHQYNNTDNTDGRIRTNRAAVGNLILLATTTRAHSPPAARPQTILTSIPGHRPIVNGDPKGVTRPPQSRSHTAHRPPTPGHKTAPSGSGGPPARDRAVTGHPQSGGGRQSHDQKRWMGPGRPNPKRPKPGAHHPSTAAPTGVPRARAASTPTPPTRTPIYVSHHGPGFAPPRGHPAAAGLGQHAPTPTSQNGRE